MKTLLLIFLFAFALSSEASNFFVKTQQSFTASTTSTKVLNASGKRNYLLVVNNGAVAVSLKIGSAHSAMEGVSIPAGGYYEPFISPRESIYLKTGSSTSSVFVLEGVEQQ